MFLASDAHGILSLVALLLSPQLTNTKASKMTVSFMIFSV
jgi:hypothetical protein